jgi:quercetin 2,3-dioxygenase
MEIVIHEAGKRGFANHEWLKSHHSFSFGDYYNPDNVHFGKLRVLNDDEVAPAQGFGLHSHKDMEIVTIPMQGSLKHNDNMDNNTVLAAGEVQVMSAGTGIMHSEFNASKTEPVHFFQIWIFTDQQGHKPRYGQKSFSESGRKEKWQLLVSRDGREDSLRIHQNAYISVIESGSLSDIAYNLHAPENGVYILVVDGAVSIEGRELNKRDAAGIWSLTGPLEIGFLQPSYLLAIEVPMH